MLQAKSRILPTDVVVPLNPTTPGTPNVTDVDFTNWRRYLAITREMDHSLDLSMQKVLFLCKISIIAYWHTHTVPYHDSEPGSH